MRRLVIAAVVLLVAGVAFVLHERTSALETHLGEVATQLGSRHVHVHCQGLAGNLLDVSSEAGTVRFDASGVPSDTTDLKRPICKALQRFPAEWRTSAFSCVVALAPCPQGIWEDVLAVHTLAHEVWHLHGISSEARAECNALQTTAQAAILLGADVRTAQAIAQYALQKIYPLLPDEYRLPECVNGGPYDLRPADAQWP
jgi:hypothetical protein